MVAPWLAALLTGIFGVTGALGGAFLTGRINVKLEKAKRDNENARTWMQYRRELYVRLALQCDSILRKAEEARKFMESDSGDGEADNQKIRDHLDEIYSAWDNQLLPVVEEVRLGTSSRTVVALAEQVSYTVLEMWSCQLWHNEFVEKFDEVKRLLADLRSAMRGELGLAPLRTAPNE